MRICVAHEAVYRYDTPCTSVIQTLRLTPRNHASQYVVNWRIDTSESCRLEPVEDAFGNVVHTFSLAGPISELRIAVDGEVETQDTAGIVRGAVERFPPSLFLRETPLTHADAAIRAYAARFPRPDAAATLQTLHSLLARVHDDFAADAGKAAADPAAGAAMASEAAAGAPAVADAFKRGSGHPRDLAHLFISTARTLGVPARFVAGYVRYGAGTSAPAASVAAGDGTGNMQTDVRTGDLRTGNSWTGDSWAEAHVPGLGWVGFDPFHGACSTDQYVRVAIGLDCLGAAPMRGFHYGGAEEEVTVRLAVTQASRQPQE
jgi:transglutaminase-like putative cysteine protease